MADEYITGVAGWFQGEVEPWEGDDSLVEVSGTYCIYTQRLTPEQMQILGTIFEQLPGCIGSDDPPWSYLFYGADDSCRQFLVTGIEPSGVVVWGRLEPHRWQEWDDRFCRLVDRAALPRFPA